MINLFPCQYTPGHFFFLAIKRKYLVHFRFSNDNEVLKSQRCHAVVGQLIRMQLLSSPHSKSTSLKHSVCWCGTCSATRCGSQSAANSQTQIQHIYYPGQKNRYTAEIFVRLIRSAIRWYHATSTATCNTSSRCAVDLPRVTSMLSRSSISHDITWLNWDQPHEFLGCNDFFGQGSICNPTWHDGACLHYSREIGTKSRHSVDRAGWQAKMATIEFWMQWRNANSPHCNTADNDWVARYGAEIDWVRGHQHTPYFSSSQSPTFLVSAFHQNMERYHMNAQWSTLQ